MSGVQKKVQNFVTFLQSFTYKKHIATKHPDQ